jgi:hypothetical protein
MPARISKMSTMLALALAAAVQAQQYPSDTKAGPNATGYLVYAYTDTQPTASTAATVFVGLTFFAPGYHQMYWALENGPTDHQSGHWDAYFFNDTYSPQAHNLPYLDVRINDRGGSPDWLWDWIYVYRYENGQPIYSKLWYLINYRSSIEPYRPWYHFGPGTPLQ